MRIGYGKLARSWELDPSKASTVGGDIDVSRLLHRLASQRPDDEFILVGRCRGGRPQQYGYPENVRNPWYSDGWELPMVTHPPGGQLSPEGFLASRDVYRGLTRDLHLDALVLWIGQVGNANSPIPPSGADWDNCKLVNPQVMSANYTVYLLDLCNRKGIEPILLCPDPRNYWKCREISRPFTHPVLAQYEMERVVRHEQYDHWGLPWQDGLVREGSQILAPLEYEYAGVELTALDHPDQIEFSTSLDREHEMGVVTNENKVEVTDATSRVKQIQKYILEHWSDAPIYGKWTDESAARLGRTIESVPYTQMYDTLRSFKMTMTFPASGSGWATAKAWEAFAVGTLMFFHHKYDEQGWIIPRTGKEWKTLRKFLIVHNQRQLWQRADKVMKDDGLYRELLEAQRLRFFEAFKHWNGGARRVIERLEEK